MTFPILFSRTKLGQIQTWQIIVENDSFYTKEGIKGGAITDTKKTTCFPKNVGKKNETTAEEQAFLQAQSKWQKKVDSGYFENESDIDKELFFSPMLAHKWNDYKDDIVYPVFSQPKLDGVRCIVDKNGMFSRAGGKPIVSAPHIKRIMQPILEDGVIFDGELYAHAFKEDFNEIISLAKKTKPETEDLANSEKNLEYWVYDCFIESKPDLTFSERFRYLKDKILSLHQDKDNLKVRFVFTEKVNNEQELDVLFEKYLEDIFEGQMIRADTPYEKNRTKNLLKRKIFMEEEFEIAGVMDGVGNSTGIATKVFFLHENGPVIFNGRKCFKAGVIGNRAYARKLFVDGDKFVGKPGTVKFFRLTPAGIPRFGKMKAVRIDY